MIQQTPSGRRSPILDRYVRLTPKSAEAQRRAQASIPAGNSRAVAHWFPYPLTLERAEGSRVWDVDGRSYVDLVNNYTSLVHGHTYPPITEIVEEQLSRGVAWTANNTWQVELAEELIRRIPAMEQVRFTNSGTEAANLALLVARTVTGRSKVLMARYGYHGQLLEFEIGAFHGMKPAPIDTTYAAPFNDAEAFERLLEEHGTEIAAVFLEPMMGAGGIVEATPEFLRRTQAAARAAGALFVLDEVITFRLDTGGLQKKLGIEPDLTLLGKLIGGGFPVGAVGGREIIMKVFDPVAPRIFHSGTYSGNPFTMAAGTISVRELTEARIERMDVLAARLERRLLESARRIGLPLSVNRCGSLLNLFFTERSPESVLVRPDQRLIGLFHLASINQGLFVAPRGVMALSTVMDEALLDETADRAAAAMSDVVAELEE